MIAPDRATCLPFPRRDIQKSPFGVRVSPCRPLPPRGHPGFEGVPPSNEGKMPSIPALLARNSPPMPTFEEPCLPSSAAIGMLR